LANRSREPEVKTFGGRPRHVIIAAMPQARLEPVAPRPAHVRGGTGELGNKSHIARKKLVVFS